MENKTCNGLIHVVKKEDTLYQISRQHQVPLAMLLRANPYVDVYNLQVGMEICVPVVSRPSVEEIKADHEMEKWMVVTDEKMTLGEFLKKYKMTLQDLEKYNDLDQIFMVKDMVLYVPKKV